MTRDKGQAEDIGYENPSAGLLPPGTVIGSNATSDCLTFCFPLDEAIPGWVACLRFLNRAGAVDLVSFEVTHFAWPYPDIDPAELDGGRAAELLDQIFREWVGARALAPVPVGIPRGGLTIRRLRGIRIGDLQSEARRYLSKSATSGGWLDPGWGAEAARRPGRASRGDQHYAALAAAYVSRLSSRAPIADLAREYHLSASTVRNQLEEARARELLTRPGQGKPGGELTDKAREILAAKGDDYGKR